MTSPTDIEPLLRSPSGHHLILSPDFTILAASEAYLRATINERVIVGQSVFAAFAREQTNPEGDDIAALRASLERALYRRQLDRISTKKYGLYRAQSAGRRIEERNFNVVNTPMIAKNGEVCYILHSVEDMTPLLGSGVGTNAAASASGISAREHPEIQLDSDRFTNAMESMQEAFALFDSDGRLFCCNAAYRRLLAGTAGDTLIGQTREQLFAAWITQVECAVGASSAELRERWLESSFEQARALELKTRAGRSLRMERWRTGQGDVLEIVRDLTDSAQRACDLRVAQAASEAKSEFLSSMSHELRTPLNAILGFAQLLMRDTKVPLASRHRERVEQIQRGGEHLLRLIDDAHDLARIESGHVSISAEPIDIADAISEVVQTLQPMALRYQVTISTQGLRAELPRILADRVRLIQILMNYGSNAIKYNRPLGTVVFRVERIHSKLRLLVEDNGMGIALDQQPKLFQPFERAGQEAGPIEGTGMGLVITKQLAELMGSSVGFRSTPEMGSSFWVELPVSLSVVSARKRSHQLTASESESAPVSVAVYIEDSAADIALMTDVFESLGGHQLVTARTAEHGLLLCQSVQPDVVLLDMSLAGPSGRETLAALRALRQTRHTPVIAIDDAVSSREQMPDERAGLLRYLSKPFDVEELISMLRKAVALAKSQGEG